METKQKKIADASSLISSGCREMLEALERLQDGKYFAAAKYFCRGARAFEAAQPLVQELADDGD